MSPSFFALAIAGVAISAVAISACGGATVRRSTATSTSLPATRRNTEARIDVAGAGAMGVRVIHSVQVHISGRTVLVALELRNLNVGQVALTGPPAAFTVPASTWGSVEPGKACVPSHSRPGWCVVAAAEYLEGARMVASNATVAVTARGDLTAAVPAGSLHFEAEVHPGEPALWAELPIQP